VFVQQLKFGSKLIPVSYSPLAQDCGEATTQPVSIDLAIGASDGNLVASRRDRREPACTSSLNRTECIKIAVTTNTGHLLENYIVKLFPNYHSPLLSFFLNQSHISIAS
jgi:hypothetical protein